MYGTADVFAGNFDTQPLVFAHLWDATGPNFDAERVEVIINTNPLPQLHHWFSEMDVKTIEDALGIMTTCVIVFSNAKAELGQGTDKLAYLGTFTPLRLRP